MQRPFDGAGSTRWPGPGGSTSAFSDDAQSQARLQAAVAAGRTAAYHSDLVTRDRWWSPEMYAVHGLSPDAPVPADYMALVHPDDRPAVLAAFQRSMDTGSHAVQYRLQWPDGTVHWLEGAGQTVRDASGAVRAVSGVCTLIDARRREQADLRFLAEASVEFAVGPTKEHDM